MTQLGHMAASIFRKGAGHKRVLVAIAGAPGAGKSTLSEDLLPLLPQGAAAIVQMDGFHHDNAVLEARGLLARKGAPETFDFAGFRHALERLKASDGEIALPVFDRKADLARAGATVIGPEIRFVLVEGNYLLLDESPWYGLAPLFDFSIFIDVPRGELAHRLVSAGSTTACHRRLRANAPFPTTWPMPSGCWPLVGSPTWSSSPKPKRKPDRPRATPPHVVLATARHG